MISIIIPAYNEEGYIGACLGHVLASHDPTYGTYFDGTVDVIVVANGCQDATVEEAQSLAPLFKRKGWSFQVIDQPTGSKPRAMNAGSHAAQNGSIVFIDADVHVSPGLIGGIAEALDRPEPAYAGGRPSIRPARTMVSERYARFWAKLPFMCQGVPGCGVFGVNAAGRARWTRIPDVISDDFFVRSHFATSEMHEVPHGYSWPITEGFDNLVRVRRRQDRGLSELSDLIPELTAKSDKTSPDLAQLIGLMAQDPVGFAIYSSVALAVRTPAFPSQSRWDRGRGTEYWEQLQVPGQ